jgi:parallel beta-helix repeat protein
MKVLPFFCALLFAGAAHSATRYVDPAHQKSVNSGAGTATAPYKTISHAMQQLVSGDRLVIKAGTYRETMNAKNGASNLVIEGSPGTVIKGSDVVTGWQGIGNGVFVRRGWTVNSQQVFVNGVSFQQIGGTISSLYPADRWPGRIAGGVSSMTPNSFYYDAGGRNLYIKPADGNLSGKTVEVSVRTRVGDGSGLNNVQIKNLSFMHSNTSATARGGALRLEGNRLVIDHISVTRADSAGLVVLGDHNLLSNSVMNYNGQTGLFARGRFVKLINNETSYNNTRGFHPNWEAGGAKFMGRGGTSPSGLMDSLISGHKALYNNGSGLWMDTMPGGGNKVVDSVVAYNQAYGIFFEISSGVEISNNLVYGNKLRGIYIAGSSNALVTHNLCVKNGIENISVTNQRLSSPSNNPQYLPRNNKVIGNLAAWPVNETLRIPDKSFNPVSNDNMFIAEKAPMFAQERNGTYAARATGLAPWKNLSGQDRNSSEKIMAPPSSIISALNARQVDIDWSALKNAAAGLRVSAITSGGGLPPGPFNYALAATSGPTRIAATPASEPPVSASTETSVAAVPAATSTAQSSVSIVSTTVAAKASAGSTSTNIPAGPIAVNAAAPTGTRSASPFGVTWRF